MRGVCAMVLSLYRRDLVVVRGEVRFSAAAKIRRQGVLYPDNMQAEVSKLQREYRQAEGQRRQWSNDTAATMRKQDMMLAKLDEDNKRLTEELALVKAEGQSMTSVADRLEELQLQATGYESLIDQESTRVDELGSEIKMLESKLKGHRTAKADLERGVKSVDSYERAIGTAENRVKKSLNDYNTQLADNTRLREQIDGLKKEREVFNELQRKLGRELSDQKAAMANVIMQSNAAFETRDEAQAKMTALQEKHEKEAVAADREIKELNRVLEHERKLRDFMGQKARSRAKELEAAEMSRRIKAESAVKPEELVEEYEDVFTQIKEITNIIENEKLVANFIETEDKNFALFNLVNELNNNIELLREQIGDVEEATKGYKEEIEVTAVERKKVLVELEAKLTEETDRAATLVNRREETTEEVKELKEKVAEAFDETGCDAEVFEAKLGEKKTDESNLMQFLGLIEQRANELLQQQALINARATRKWEEEATKLIQQNALSADPKPDFDPANELPAKPEAPKGLLGAGPTVTTIGLIEPPSAIDDDDDDDDEDLNTRPLTMDELRQRVAASRTSKVSA
eukprot:m.284546 g.284546  ORF g.284546 m.284546 type:complete len:575 (+) comp27020_c2_seq2:239-1963(+)